MGCGCTLRRLGLIYKLKGNSIWPFRPTVGVKIKFPFTVGLSTVYCLNGNSFSCVFSVHTTDKLNVCSVISTS